MAKVSLKYCFSSNIRIPYKISKINYTEETAFRY